LSTDQAPQKISLFQAQPTRRGKFALAAVTKTNTEECCARNGVSFSCQEDLYHDIRIIIQFGFAHDASCCLHHVSNANYYVKSGKLDKSNKHLSDF